MDLRCKVQVRGSTKLLKSILRDAWESLDFIRWVPECLHKMALQFILEVFQFRKVVERLKASGYPKGMRPPTRWAWTSYLIRRHSARRKHCPTPFWVKRLPQYLDRGTLSRNHIEKHAQWHERMRSHCALYLFYLFIFLCTQCPPDCSYCNRLSLRGNIVYRRWWDGQDQSQSMALTDRPSVTQPEAGLPLIDMCGTEAAL